MMKDYNKHLKIKFVNGYHVSPYRIFMILTQDKTVISYVQIKNWIFYLILLPKVI